MDEQKVKKIVWDFDVMFASVSELEERIAKVINEYRKELYERRREALKEQVNYDNY